MSYLKLLCQAVVLVGVSSQVVWGSVSLPPLAGQKGLSWDDPSTLPNGNGAYLFTADTNYSGQNIDQNAFTAVLGVLVDQSQLVKDQVLGPGTDNGGKFDVEMTGDPNVVKWSATFLPAYVALKFGNLFTVYNTVGATFSAGLWSETLTIGERPPNPDSLSHAVALIPEPSSMLVWLGIGSLGLAAYRKRQLVG